MQIMSSDQDQVPDNFVNPDNFRLPASFENNFPQTEHAFLQSLPSQFSGWANMGNIYPSIQLQDYLAECYDFGPYLVLRNINRKAFYGVTSGLGVHALDLSEFCHYDDISSFIVQFDIDRVLRTLDDLPVVSGRIEFYIKGIYEKRLTKVNHIERAMDGRRNRLSRIPTLIYLQKMDQIMV